MKCKQILALLLALVLCLAPMSAFAAGEEEEEAALPGLGDELEDFSFTTFDGEEYTLSEVLKEKDMVLLNLWATWCGPCEMEFPNMEKAYEQYKDDVEIFALSVEPEDTDEVLADYVEEHGMTFPVGRDEVGLSDIFVDEGIPTSVVIDRNGVICAIEVGSQTAEEAFPLLFDEFVGDDYTEPNILTDGFPEPPPPEPTVAPTDPEELAAALLGEDAGDVTVFNPEDKYNWPVAVYEDEDEDVTCLVTTNAEQDRSSSAVGLTVNAQAGDVLSLQYKVSCECYYDDLFVMVDGEQVKTLTGERDWLAFAYTFEEAGEYEVLLGYEKDEMEASGDDMAWFDEVRLVSGEAAEEALAAVPVYPHGEETALTVISEDAQEVVFDPDLEEMVGTPVKAYIVPSGTAEFSVTVAEGVDPDGSFITCDYDGVFYTLAECLDGEEFLYSTDIDSMEETGYSYSEVDFYTDDPDDPGLVVWLLVSEENANTLLEDYELDGWTYADGTEPSTDETAKAGDESEEGYSSYALVFTDQNGDPVEGVIANVCDDDTCEPMTSDEDGTIMFEKPAFAYHVQVIKVPDGYEYDTSEETYLKEDGGVTLFKLDKK